MALFRWRGTTAAWNTDSNWINEVGTPYGGGRYPGSAAGTYDDVILDVVPTTALAGYDAAADEVLASFRIGGDYTGNVASSGAYLRIEVSHDSDAQTPDSATVIDAEQTGNIYLRGIGTYGLRRLTVTSTHQSGAASGQLYLQGKIGSAEFLKGVIQLLATGVAVNISDSLFVGYLTNPGSDVTLSIVSGITLPSTITVAGGQISNGGLNITTLILRDASWANYLGNITNLYQYGSSHFVWVESTINYAEIHGGTLDATQDSDIGRSFDIIKAYQQATLKLRNDLGNNTVSIGGYIETFGAKIEWNYGQKLLPIPG